MLEGRSEVWFEQIIQYLAALRFRVIDQQPRRRSGADPPDAFKSPSFSGTVDFDLRFLQGLLAGQRGKEYSQYGEY
jgi:hypothetical protein